MNEHHSSGFDTSQNSHYNTFDILIMLGLKGILSKPTCLSMACNFILLKITFNQSLFVPKHLCLIITCLPHQRRIIPSKYIINKIPLTIGPYSRFWKTPCSWSPVHLPNHHPINDGWQLTPTTYQTLITYHSKLYQG